MSLPAARHRAPEASVGTRAAGPGEHALEGVAEVAVEDAVDERIERAVEVAEPREDGEEDGRHARAAGAVVAEGGHQVDGEEGRPAEEEDAHDDSERHGRLVVGEQVAVLRRVGRLSGHPRRLPTDGTHVRACVAVEAQVDEDHDEAGQVEADGRRQHGVERVQFEQALGGAAGRGWRRQQARGWRRQASRGRRQARSACRQARGRRR